MACNPLLKNAERKTRQSVGSPKDSKGVAAKAGAGGAPQPRGALQREQSWLHGTITSRGMESPLHLLLLCPSHWRDHAVWERDPE